MTAVHPKGRWNRAGRPIHGGRVLGDIGFVDGTWLSKRLLAAGHAKEYTGSGPHPDWCSFPIESSQSMKPVDIPHHVGEKDDRYGEVGDCQRET